ncbi:pyridoxamine 5'-phosphate oxidase family protein [Haloferax sp. DFSO60]|uniref:pyridoxamine 5'-phosphate oxidase family protein n=1 Tax=Haloferax sp. DFSO60 TaxID=3388652 RepID=UPI00397DCBEB
MTAHDASSRDRPVTESSYGIPTNKDGLLSWSIVEDAFAEDRVFWISTTRPDGNPHARPVWGVWVDGAFHCGGGENTRWVRNLAHNSHLTVHRESGTDVVILEGVAERLDEQTADESTLERIDDAYEEKYDIRHGTPVFRIHPARVLAWSDFPTDATRWTFDSM